MGSEPLYATYPVLSLAQNVFTLTNPSAQRSAQETSVKTLQDAISEYKMAPLYKYLAHPTEGILNSSGESTSSQHNKLPGRKPSVGMVASREAVSHVDLPWNEAIYEQLKKENEEELEQFKKEEEEAEEKAGETEVDAAQGKRAEFYARVGDKVWLVDSD